ncbi:hypothetical protein RRG08_056258 [Elysia crispata]|uniref:Uncharacterized protein n=1 Tax=Elysia crispata TaxID=231223 RepID=A0AAE1E6C5_9GAST|nr:hypothetical protein RRG08_056258 [Elysia crispata]
MGFRASLHRLYRYQGLYPSSPPQSASLYPRFVQCHIHTHSSPAPASSTQVSNCSQRSQFLWFSPSFSALSLAGLHGKRDFVGARLAQSLRVKRFDKSFVCRCMRLSLITWTSTTLTW